MMLMGSAENDGASNSGLFLEQGLSLEVVDALLGFYNLIQNSHFPVRMSLHLKEYRSIPILG